MSGFWVVIGVSVGIGLVVYVVCTGVSMLYERFGQALDAISGEGSDVRRQEPPQTRHPHRPIY